MSGILAQATTGKRIGQRKILVYGEAGVGKTTWACSAPAAVMIQTEEGADHIDVPRLPVCDSYDTFREQLAGIVKEDHSYETLVIDSMDWLEPLIEQAVCDELGIEAIGDLPMGKGYQMLARKWTSVCAGLRLAAEKRGMHIIMVAHAQVRPVYEPGGGDGYDRFSPKLSRKGNAIVSEFCSEILLARIVGRTEQQQQAFGKKAVATGATERRLFCQPLRWLVAKNRLGLPESLPLEWAAFAEYLSEGSK